jgi:Na+/melibiose symporter-like transporter
VAVKLAKAWWQSRGSRQPAAALVWAVTLTWTLVMNVYVPMYDTVLVVLSLIVTAGVLKNLQKERLYGWLTLLWLTLYASYWITERVANATGVQIVTLLLCGLGTLQLVALNQVSRLGLPKPATGTSTAT